MAVPSSEEEGILREWAPLTDLLQQIPLKAQRGLFTHSLSLTCVDTLPEFIAVGTSLGLVYWYNRKKRDLQRLRCENTGSAITCVRVISTVDFMVAAGNDEGIVTVFQIPKILPDSLPESIKPKKNKQVERYTISGLHTSPVTAIEWSMNGMKMFSGDKNGLVVLTEIDFYMHLSKSVEIINEKYEIVQLSYSQQLLLVSTLYRSIVCCHRDDHWKVTQVGQKERKVLGRLGATLCLGSGRPNELVVYASRPGLRVWLADKTGIVQQTLIYKDAVVKENTHMPLINPASSHVRHMHGDHQFGPLLVFQEHLLVTYSSDVVYVLNPATISVIATIADLRRVLDVAVSKDEIFILEGERSLIRVAYTPENTVPLAQGTKFDYGTENMLPISLSDISIASSIRDLSSKLKDSAVVSAIPLPKLSTRMNVFGSPVSEYDGTSSQQGFEHLNAVMMADEATELPPVIAISPDDLVDLNVKKLAIPGVDCAASSSKDCNEFYRTSKKNNTGSQRIRALHSENLRTEILDRIGEQQYEDVLFKPKQRKGKSNKKHKKKFICGTESGSDTMSTNSVCSASDCEDQWSGKRLDVNSDLSVSAKQSERCNSMQLDTGSSSEETLVRLADCIGNSVETLHDDNCCEHDGKINHTSTSDETGNSQKSRNGRRTNYLSLGEESSVTLEILPDLRSPASIQRDVANKEKILAKILQLDSLCDQDPASENHPYNINKVETQEITAEDIKLKCNYILNEKLTSDNEDGEQKTDAQERQSALGNDHSDKQQDFPDEQLGSLDSQDEKLASYDSQDEKVASFSSILSYGPPSGSSAPPSNHTSLETFNSSDFKTEPNCSVNLYKTMEQTDKWMKFNLPGTILNLSACKHYVCCVDAKDMVYYSSLNGLSLKWQKLDYKAKQIAISLDGTLVWRLYKSTAYALENPSLKGPFGRKWIAVSGVVQWISVADKTAWYISEGLIFVHQELTSGHPSSTAMFVECGQAVTRVCCLQDSMIVLTLQGEVLFRSGVANRVAREAEWKILDVPCTDVADVALGCHDTAWLVDHKNTIYFSCDFTKPDAHWWQVLISDYIFQRTPSLQKIHDRLKLTEKLHIYQQASIIVATGENMVWISDKNATGIYMNKTEFTGYQWRNVYLGHHKISLKWQKISAEGVFENQGQLWLLSTAGDMFVTSCFTHTLHGLPMLDKDPVACLATATNTAWILTTTGRIYTRSGFSDTYPAGMIWKELNLIQLGGTHLTHISCGCDVVWACDDQGQVYMAIGPPSSIANLAFIPAWIVVDDLQPEIGYQNMTKRKTVFTKVFVGSQTYMVWALDVKNKVYVREGIYNDLQVGTGWVLVHGIKAVELSISGTAVWAVSPEGSVYRRYGITNTNFVGDYWKKLPGSVISITVSVSDDLWALDKNQSLLQLNHHSVTLSEPAVASGGAPNMTSDGEWEVI